MHIFLFNLNGILVHQVGYIGLLKDTTLGQLSRYELCQQREANKGTLLSQELGWQLVVVTQAQFHAYQLEENVPIAKDFFK